MKPTEIIGAGEVQFTLPEITRRIKKLEEIVDVLSERLEAMDSLTLMDVPTTRGDEVRAVEFIKKEALVGFTET